MKILLIIFTILLLTNNCIQGQCCQIDSNEKVLEIQSNEKGDMFYLLQKHIGVDSLRFQRRRPLILLYVKCCSSKDNATSIIVLDTTLSEDWGYGYSGRGPLLGRGMMLLTLHICFQDKNKGFVYGIEDGYGYFPFIFRTTDGGINWDKTITDSLTVGSVFLRKNDFSMMNSQMGFLLFNDYQESEENRIRCYTTNDGGEHWEIRIVKVNQPGFRIADSEFQTTSNGVITVTLTMAKKVVLTPENANKPVETKNIILQSRDFGRSFKEYK